MNETLTDETRSKLTIGVDLGDRSSQCCVLGADGEVLEQATVPTTQAGLRRWFAGKQSARVILEAGTHSHWVSRLVAELGHEVIVANPRMLRFIYGNDSKNDKADAAYLARVGRLDPALLKPIVHRSEVVQADRALIRSREALVRTRASLVTLNRLLNVVRPFVRPRDFRDESDEGPKRGKTGPDEDEWDKYKPLGYWRSPSLLGILALQLYWDLTRDPNVKAHVCLYCGTPFVSSAYQAKYCSEKCRAAEIKKRRREK